MKLFILVLLKFFLISALFIISNGNLHISDSGERSIFLENYSSWLTRVFDQGSQIAGYAINTRWLPQGEINLIS